MVLLEITAFVGAFIFVYRTWASMSPLFRLLLVIGVVSSAAGLMFQFFGTEIIEIDSRKLTIIKEIHGWERTRAYPLNECRELEWMEGAKGVPEGLRCKVGWRTIIFGRNITENQAAQILTALNHTVPGAAQQLCSYPEDKTHFITLGLR